VWKGFSPNILANYLSSWRNKLSPSTKLARVEIEEPSRSSRLTWAIYSERLQRGLDMMGIKSAGRM